MHFFDKLLNKGNLVETIVVPSGIEDKLVLFDFYSNAFHFPDWFGRNWDALLDCLRDLRDDSKQICIQHSDVPFLSNPRDLEKYLNVLFLTCILHKGNIVVLFQDECQDMIDNVILAYWQRMSNAIKTKEDVVAAATKVVFPQGV